MDHCQCGWHCVKGHTNLQNTIVYQLVYYTRHWRKESFISFVDHTVDDWFLIKMCNKLYYPSHAWWFEPRRHAAKARTTCWIIMHGAWWLHSVYSVTTSFDTFKFASYHQLKQQVNKYLKCFIVQVFTYIIEKQVFGDTSISSASSASASIASYSFSRVVKSLLHLSLIFWPFSSSFSTALQ